MKTSFTSSRAPSRPAIRNRDCFSSRSDGSTRTASDCGISLSTPTAIPRLPPLTEGSAAVQQPPERREGKRDDCHQTEDRYALQIRNGIDGDLGNGLRFARIGSSFPWQ